MTRCLSLHPPPLPLTLLHLHERDLPADEGDEGEHGEEDEDDDGLQAEDGGALALVLDEVFGHGHALAVYTDGVVGPARPGVHLRRLLELLGLLERLEALREVRLVVLVVVAPGPVHPARLPALPPLPPVPVLAHSHFTFRR